MEILLPALSQNLHRDCTVTLLFILPDSASLNYGSWNHLESRSFAPWHGSPEGSAGDYKYGLTNTKAAYCIPAIPSPAALDSPVMSITIGAKKEPDFSSWPSNALPKVEMMDCYSTWFNTEIKKLGVQNSHFLMFISQFVLEREKDHIEGFSPEVAWVTRGLTLKNLSPSVLRLKLYPYNAKWIRMHRDLPLKHSQWNSVVRWEFKSPQPFLRTREILDLYRQDYENLLAVPVIPGVKPEREV
ncbi:hypothetical protein BKA70DRAFT_1437104 [Coprinopsis sp. MPI-PUGE-AT-0042]|nr:hypothetical protein BKA70DRAFT_1437104 [Coprinopsis sp. MPI-PUGE-AT-0042]